MFSWCMIGALICLFLPQSISARLHMAFLGLYKFTPSLGRSVPQLAVVARPAVLANQNDEGSNRLKQLENEKNQLQNHISNLSAELESEHGKVESLAAMRARFPGLSGAAFINADVVAAFKASDNRIMINRGQADGVCKGQYVLAENSVVGLVHEVQARTAVVRLITDKESSIAVEIAGSKAVRVMKGTGKEVARIGMVPNKKRVNKGDAVYTYKNPGLLDVPMIVGRISECRPDDENPLLWDIKVKPAVKIDEITAVTIVVMNPRK